MRKKDKNYWVCIIGPVRRKKLPDGADAKPRMAVQDAVIEMTGVSPACWSGWGVDQRTFKKLMKAWDKD